MPPSAISSSWPGFFNIKNLVVLYVENTSAVTVFDMTDVMIPVSDWLGLPLQRRFIQFRKVLYQIQLASGSE